MKTEKLRVKDETNRRSKSRFPIHRELRYKLLQNGKTLGAGLGETMNMGSGGVAFSMDRELAAGSFVELSISWPVQLGDGTPMRLVIFGRVLRSGPGMSACTVDKYEFRTQSRNPQPNEISHADRTLHHRGNRVGPGPARLGILTSMGY